MSFPRYGLERACSDSVVCEQDKFCTRFSSIKWGFVTEYMIIAELPKFYFCFMFIVGDKSFF